MAAALRSAFIGIPSLISREALRAVHRHSTLIGVAESKPSSWRLAAGTSRYRSPFTFVAKRLQISHRLIGQGVVADETLAEWLARLKPDVLCVAGMTRLLTSEEFSIPRLGAINLHPSLLPRYRGPEPFYWQYHDCDLQGGVTIHQITSSADEGDILEQNPFPIALGDSLETTLAQASRVGAAAMENALHQLSTGKPYFRLQQYLVNYPFARFVGKGEAPTGWLEWPLDRVWHFLKGTHGRHPFLAVPFGAAHQWRIGERERGKTISEAIVTQDDRGYLLAHPAGRVRLFPPAPWTVRRKIQRRISQYVQAFRWRM